MKYTGAQVPVSLIHIYITPHNTYDAYASISGIICIQTLYWYDLYICIYIDAGLFYQSLFSKEVKRFTRFACSVKSLSSYFS